MRPDLAIWRSFTIKYSQEAFMEEFILKDGMKDMVLARIIE
ncbi:MAG: hypothetical protein ABFD25_04790 [Clostridiaceae bacterium]